MNESVKAKWVAALRSGEYGQARRQLRVEDKFCCLGVLCDLHAKETGGRWFDGGYLQYRNKLPWAVCEWAGLTELEFPSNPEVPGGALAEHNDGLNGLHSKTFTEIADLIEKHL